MICKRIIIKGHVQGVFFRATAREKAEQLGVTGEVRNLRDGSVEVLACGTEEQLKELVGWCRQGPPKADVHAVEVNDLERKEFTGFRVIRGGF